MRKRAEPGLRPVPAPRAVRVGALTALWLLSSCASYPPLEGPGPALPLPIEGAATITGRGVTVAARVLLREDDAGVYLGMDPRQTFMAPLALRVSNQRPDPIRVDVKGARLIAGKKRLEPRSLRQAIEGMKPDEPANVIVASTLFLIGPVGLPLGFVAGRAAAAETARVNQLIEKDYFRKGFRPTLIRPGESAEGVLFFDVPAYWQDRLREAEIPILALEDGRRLRYVVDLRGSREPDGEAAP